MPSIQIVILLSLSSFQATIPGLTREASPTFQDSAQGLQEFSSWAQRMLGEPKFNQPPHHLCVVGASAFPEKGPYISEPISKSRMPVRALEPYYATFHYVEATDATKPAKPRTMKQAVSLCAKNRPAAAK